jgi:hypothetical protein
MYDKIQMLPNPYHVLTDTAYRGGITADDNKIIKILKEGQLIPAGWTLDQVSRAERWITKGRQPSEWSNNQFVQFMKRTRCVLGIDDNYNSKIIELSILLCNFRVNYTDRNQTKRHFINLMILAWDPDLKARIYDD